ncbi:hypothetical protein P3X46_011298 [Hevea brasiliensis]|uniref:Cysteine proteinase inhibitor n=1 Tax=Hevea brasiliensis TaxID=3981 RepID=A0ABQ9MJF1_HEVBR|nr:hypothetical protein P3X46_011298 [Hevea brasiliensis]
MATLGGVRDSQCTANSVEIDSLARFAVEQHNNKENAMLESARVVKAKEQVVAGTLHHLTIEEIEAGKKKLYEAKVWVKPWLNFKELQEFKHTSDVDGGVASSFTPSDVGVKKDHKALAFSFGFVNQMGMVLDGKKCHYMILQCKMLPAVL